MSDPIPEGYISVHAAWELFRSLVAKDEHLPQPSYKNKSEWEAFNRKNSRFWKREEARQKKLIIAFARGDLDVLVRHPGGERFRLTPNDWRTVYHPAQVFITDEIHVLADKGWQAHRGRVPLIKEEDFLRWLTRVGDRMSVANSVIDAVLCKRSKDGIASDDAAGSNAERSEEPGQIDRIRGEIQIFADVSERRVMFNGWGGISSAGTDLLLILVESFKDAVSKELSPENYPFIASKKLVQLTDCGSLETLRRLICRCRNSITELAKQAGVSPPSRTAVIETRQGKGYRLNPNHIRIVALSELRQSE